MAKSPRRDTCMDFAVETWTTYGSAPNYAVSTVKWVFGARVKVGAQVRVGIKGRVCHKESPTKHDRGVAVGIAAECVLGPESKVI
jgi:hypothetical protein